MSGELASFLSIVVSLLVSNWQSLTALMVVKCKIISAAMLQRVHTLKSTELAH